MLFFSWDFFSHELRHGLFHSAWLMQYTRFHHRRAPEPKPFHTAQKERPPCLLSLCISWKKEWSLFPSVCTQSQRHVHSRLLSQGQKLDQLTVRPPLYSCRYEHEPNASSRHTYCVFLTESAHPFPTVLTIPFTLTTLPNVCLQTSLQRYGPACSPVLLCWDAIPWVTQAAFVALSSISCADPLSYYILPLARIRYFQLFSIHSLALSFPLPEINSNPWSIW